MTTATRTCPHYDAGYCAAHDYDHVLERQEAAALAGDGMAAINADALYAVLADLPPRHGLPAGTLTVPASQEALFADGSGFASDTGRRAANGWPPAIVLAGTIYRGHSRQVDREGELQSVTYATAGGRRLLLWND